MAWYVRNGSAWVDTMSLVTGNAPLVQAGSVNVTLSASAAGSSVVTFPRAFSAAPIVSSTPVVGSATLVATALAVTTSQLTAQLTRKDGVSTTVTAPVHWIAVGPR